MKKGMTTTLALVVAAVVILITALILIAIFGGGMGRVVDYTTRRNLCVSTAAASCASFGQLPNDWYAPVEYRDGNEVKTASCNTLTDGSCLCDGSKLMCGES